MLKLKHVLEENNISQRKLAGWLSVSPAVITNLVNHGQMIKTDTAQFKQRLLHARGGVSSEAVT